MTESLAVFDGNGLMIGRKVTRCGDCKHFTPIGELSPSGDLLNAVIGGKCGYFWDAFVTDDGFCAWGESKAVE